MKTYNKLSIRLFDGIIDEWTDNYSHSEFSDDGRAILVYKKDNEKKMTAWYNTEYVTSIIVQEVEIKE